jgi:ATP-dependent Clp protease ATP-binding subunit ClpX
MSGKSKTTLHCSFCGTPQHEVKKLVAGPNGVYICNGCVDICNDVLREAVLKSTGKGAYNEDGTPMTPSQVFAKLGERVIGQEFAKKTLAIAVAEHMRKIGYTGDVILDSSNILLIGPSGNGKTQLARALAALLNVPYAEGDATKMTEAGYVGEDVESILVKLFQAADGDLEKAQNGIVYIDEIDKIKSQGGAGQRDVGGEGVQNALLKLIEGGTFTIQPDGRTGQSVEFNTQKVLVIAAGAFDGLEKIIEKRENQAGMGFSSTVVSKDDKKGFNELLESVITDDLIQYGMSRQFIGRFHIIVPLRLLTEDELITILTEPSDAVVKQMKTLSELSGFDIEFVADTYVDDDPEKGIKKAGALRNVAKKAIAHKTGARSLRSVLEQILHDAKYEIPDKKDVVKVIVSVDLDENNQLVHSYKEIKGERKQAKKKDLSDPWGENAKK